MTNAHPITLTERAAARIQEVIAQEPGAIGLRLAVSGGGCSGFQYEFAVATAQNPDDLSIAMHGAVLLIDDISIPYVEGSQLDYVDDLIGAKFEVLNPKAKASCGCGTSFSL